MIFKMTESFLWVNVLLRRRKLFKVAHGRHKIMQYVDCVTKELRSIPAFEITSDRTVELFQKQMSLFLSLLNC